MMRMLAPLPGAGSTMRSNFATALNSPTAAESSTSLKTRSPSPGRGADRR